MGIKDKISEVIYNQHRQTRLLEALVDRVNTMNDILSTGKGQPEAWCSNRVKAKILRQKSPEIYDLVMEIFKLYLSPSKEPKRQALSELKSHSEVVCEGTIFPQVGSVQILPWYADSKIYCLELRLSLPFHDWYEFEKQPFYHDLIQYLHSKGIRGSEELLREGRDSEETKGF